MVYKRQALSKKQKYVLREANARWNLLTGSVRSGKTVASFFLLPLRVKYQGPGNFMLVGKTERTLIRNVIEPLRALYGSDNVSRLYGKGNQIDLFGRPAYVVGANDDRAVAKIQGIGLVYCMGDEVSTWPEPFFQMLKSRLDKPGAKFDGTSNPESPYHWLKKFIDTTDLDIKHIPFRIDDNPFLDRMFVQQLKMEYTGLWYKRYIEGLWVMAEGAVYDMFDESRHVIDLPPASPTAYYVAVDYGTNNPTAFGLYGVKDDLAWKEREYYYDYTVQGRQKTDVEYSQDMKTFLGNIKPRAIIVDPSALSFKAQLRKDGFHNVIEADNAVLDGIRTQATMLHQGRYYIHRSCKETIREYGGYVWDVRAQAQGQDKPLKQNDHTKDEERYFLHTVFGKTPGLAPFNKRLLGL